MSEFFTAGVTLQSLNIIIENIKTDIWFIDLLLTALVMFAINKGTLYLQNRFNRIHLNNIKDIIKNCFKKRKQRTYFSDRKANYEGSYNSCKEFIPALCDYIDKGISDKSFGIDISSINKEEDYTMNSYEGYGDDESTLIRLGKINIPKFNITVECELHNKEREEKQVKSEYKEIEVIIYSDTLLEIKIFVEHILKTYEINIDIVSNEKTNIYSCRKFCNENSYPKYFELELHKKTTFNNLFFDNKHLLKKMIEDVYYGKRDRLSLLLYGPPGTGKDSVTVAICHYLNELEQKNNNGEIKKRRHIIRYPMDVFKKADDLFRIFFGNDKIAGKKIPNNQQIRFFTEVEKYTDIILKEKLKEVVVKNHDSKNLNETMFEFIKKNTELNLELDEQNLELFEEIKKSCSKNSNNNSGSELKLAHLIECLDSVLNQEGTINIFTSNLPLELIDDVLIRHERLDPFYLGYCSSQTIVDIIKYHYQYNGTIDIKQFDRLKKLVPADISYHCKNNNTVEECIQSILKTM